MDMRNAGTRSARQPAFKRSAALGIVIGLLAASTAWTFVDSATARADSSATTVTGNHAWNPKENADFANKASVTVDQTANIVGQVVHVSWKNFTPTQNPNTDAVLYPVRIYECRAATVTSLASCFSTPGYQAQHADATNIEANTNTVYAATNSDGTGGADFSVLTGADEPTLGCNADHPCSIVAEPDFGGNSLAGNCADHSEDSLWATTSGSYWGKDPSCSWQNRIVVPLSFEPTPDDCPSDRNADFDTEGAPLLSRALDGWRPGICQDTKSGKGLLVGYTEVGEYQARSDFQTGSVDVALTNRPTSVTSSRRYTYAPISVSGIAIAYYVDDPSNGQPIMGLKLNARLIAKMLTQSYPGIFARCQDSAFYPCAREDAGNPTSIFADPEFRQLNPAFKSLASFSDDGNSFPTVVFGDSDLTYQLTSWIASDPDATAFLNGQNDPWGMHLNSYYLPGSSPRYPITQFTANDPGETKKQKYNCGRQGDNTTSCVTDGIQSTWFPVNGVHNVARTLLAGKITAKVPAASCPGGVGITNNTCDQHAGSAPMPLGTRAAFAVVSEADAAAYRFPVAQLETRAGTFVGPTTQAMSLAVTDMATNPDQITQMLDYGRLTDPAAYPLTAVSYAMVPTCGESSATASNIANLLNFIASDGAQVYGSAPGQLGLGYVALSDTMRAQTTAAAQAVQAQTCPASPLPSLSPAPTASPTPSSESTAADSGGAGNSGDSPSVADATDAAPPAAGTTATSSHATAIDPAGSAHVTSANGRKMTPASFGRPGQDSAGLPGLMIPIVLIGGAVLLVGGPTAYALGRTGTGAVAWQRLLRILRR